MVMIAVNRRGANGDYGNFEPPGDKTIIEIDWWKEMQREVT
jgi:hypothetical protein